MQKESVMNAERQIQARNIRHAIDRTMEGLKWAHEHGVRGAWVEHMRHLTRLLEIEYAILSMVKFEASEQESK
jgi:hypothetical protein